MRIEVTSIFVNDQDKALKFYTEKLGFVKKMDITAGQYRWLTVVASEDKDGTQLVLEPNSNPASKTYQEAIFNQSIPAQLFFVDDIQKEYEKLKKFDVKFTMEPTKVTGSTLQCAMTHAAISYNSVKCSTNLFSLLNSKMKLK
jgi:catechol 2,3-dioxygenase-like lactoylglutathione lyase family enzyme